MLADFCEMPTYEACHNSLSMLSGRFFRLAHSWVALSWTKPTTNLRHTTEQESNAENQYIESPLLFPTITPRLLTFSTTFQILHFFYSHSINRCNGSWRKLPQSPRGCCSNGGALLIWEGKSTYSESQSVGQ